MKRIAMLPFATVLFLAVAAHADGTKPALPPGITAPVPANVHTVPPEDYPAISRAMHEEGMVRLGILITEDGHATEAKIVKSSGFPRLDQAAAEVVMRDWLYKPATKDGKPIAVRTEVNVNFHVRQSEFNLTVKPDAPFIVFRMGPKDYPPNALAQKEETVVGLLVVVNEEGKVVQAYPTHPSSFPDLDQASIAIAKTWHLKAALLDGKPVRTVLSPLFVWLLHEPADDTPSPAVAIPLDH